MTIGLVRHFKVDLPFNKPGYTPREFNRQMERYDTAPVIPNDLDISAFEWDKCYCSDLERAVITANTIYRGNITITPLLREVPLSSFTRRNIKLPGFIWHLGGRISWRRNKRIQPETFKETIARIESLYELITANGNEKVLLVTHGFFMRVFQEFMKKKGFKGEIDFRPVNGKLYTINNGL